MAIGLTGAQRVGKSTLAAAFEAEQGIFLQKTSTSDIFKAIGRDPAADYPLAERLAIQTVVLDGLTQQYEAASRAHDLWITDRTPIDMAAYMLADVRRTSTTGTRGLDEGVVAYVDACIEVTNRFFGTLILVQPGIPIVEEPGKAGGGRAYQEHINALIFGLLMDERLGRRHFFLKRSQLTIPERLNATSRAVMASIEASRKTQELERAVVH